MSRRGRNEVQPHKFDEAGPRVYVVRGEVVLRVAKASSTDVGSRRARVGKDVMEALGIGVGDVVKIVGKKTAIAKVYCVHPEEKGDGTIRIDSLLRREAGTRVGRSVEIRRGSAQDRRRVREDILRIYRELGIPQDRLLRLSDVLTYFREHPRPKVQP